MQCRLIFHPTSDANRLICKIHVCGRLFNGQCPVMSSTKILNMDLGSLSKYLVKRRPGFFSHIPDWRQAVSKLREAQCYSSSHSHALRLTLEGADGKQGSGPTKAEIDLALASASASSLPWIPQCPGTHTSQTLLHKDKWESLSEHFSDPLSPPYDRMGLTTEVYSQGTTFGDNPQVFPTARRHCQYAMQALCILFSRCA
jgi:hypothetical protein